MLIVSENVAELLLAGHFEEAWHMIEEYTDAGHNSLFIYQQILTKAMRHVGYLWEENLISVADEHLASGVCDYLLARYSSLVKQRNYRQGDVISRGKVMLLCLEGEEHDLGLKMVSTIFEEAGWSVRSYGANLPLEYAILSAAGWKPDVIGLSVAMSHHCAKLAEYISAFEAMQHRPLVMVGGRLVGMMDLLPYCSKRTMLITDLIALHQWMELLELPKEKRNMG